MTNIKAKNRIVQYILTVAIILIMSVICAVCFRTTTAVAKSDFSQGSGTEDDPFVVTTVKEFNAVATRLDAYFVQGANIDFTDEEFYPIGDLTHPFTGHYDGQQYLLSGINADYPNKDYVGVFSFVYKDGVIKNVRVENSVFVGGQNVGAIAGMNAGRIEGSVANSEVVANNNAVGGIVGNNSGYISCSVNSGSISTLGMYAGGISGVNSGSISNVYNRGSVSAQTYVGGIAGLNNGKDSKAVIERAFQVGEISGNVRGNVSGDNMNATIKQCRHIQGSQLNIVSAFNSGGNITASAARPAYEFKTKTAFADWADFDDNFMFIADVNHPILKAEYVKVSGIEFVAGKKIELRPGEEIELGAYVTPMHASVQNIKLAIDSGEEFCSLTDDGVIKIKEDAQVGSFITVVGEAEGVVGLAQIEIIPIRVEGIELASEDGRTTIVPGAQLQLSANIYPDNASIKDVRYVSSNPFADVDVDGILRVSHDAPVGLVFTVTVSSYDNISISDELTFTIIQASVKSIEITNTVTDFKVTGSLSLNGQAVTESNTTEEVDFEIISEDTTAEGARIVGGKLYADLPGEISVVARYAGTSSNPVVFVAKEEPVTSIEFLNGNSFPINGALNIIAQALPDYATFRDVTLKFVETNNTGATLKDNVLTAKSTGMITICAEAGGVSATMTIYAEPASESLIEVTGISLATDSYLLTRTFTPIPIIEPSNAQAAVYFELISDGGTGVELVNGKLQNAKRPGIIILCAYTANFRTYVTVEAQKVGVESVFFNNADKFKITQSLALRVVTNPTNPTYADVTYQIISSTANGVTITNGILTAQSVGEIVLRAWVDGVPSSEFKIYAEKEPVTDVRFTSSSKSFKHTESLILEAMALPMQATYKNIEFRIDEAGTTEGIEANINGNVLTAKAPGTVTVIMNCDGHDYPVIIAVEKEPVIAVSELETRLWTVNSQESVFRTSGILELTAYVYPLNATYQGIEISIVNDGGTEARFVSGPFVNVNWDIEAVTLKQILSGEKDVIYLAAKNAGSVIVRVKSIDNPQIYVDYTVVVNEEYVADIYFGMLETSAIDTAKAAEEVISSDSIIGNRNGADYYYFTEMFFKANQLDANGNLTSTFTLTFDVFTYAGNRNVSPTSDDEYTLYYYKNYEDYVNNNIANRIMVGSDQDTYLIKENNKLIAQTKKVVLWLFAVSTHGENGEVVSKPMKLTIYPTNIADLKSLKIDNNTGIISSSMTANIGDMSGYEITVTSSKINFTKFIPTQYTQLWLKLYKYSIKSYDVTVDVVFDYGDVDEYRYTVPTEEFHGIQSLPKNQIGSIKGGSQYSAVVIYDLNFSKYAFNRNVEFDDGVKYMYLYGNNTQQHTGINFKFDNNYSPVEITLHNIHYVANSSQHAIRICGTGRLTLNVIGDVMLQGGASSNGKNGTNGKSYYLSAANGVSGKDGNMNWNPFGEVPSGQDGANGSNGKNGGDGATGGNGTNGGYGIRLAVDNNVDFHIDASSSLQLIGIDGGNGGKGGDGGNGQPGGKGGRGGNGDIKYAVVAAIPGDGGNGGKGGDGGNGGNGGSGGNAGRGGLSINASSVKNNAYVTWTDGKDGQVGSGGAKGLGGSGGIGGSGGAKGQGSIMGVTYNGKDGSNGANGKSGVAGIDGKNGVLRALD